MPLLLSRELKKIRKVARAKPIRHRTRRIPRQRYPDAVVAEYGEALVEIAVQLSRRALEPLMRELPELLDSAARARADASDQRCGFDVVVENRRGTVRQWRDADGGVGKTMMLWDYGYLEGYVGADGEEVDVYLGPARDSEWVYVVHQNSKASGFAEYDEDKVMLGFWSEDSARVAYLAQYDDRRFLGGMSIFSIDDFRKTLSERSGQKLTHLDAGEGSRARRLIEAAREQVRKNIHHVEQLAKKFAERTSRHQLREMGRQVKAALGVDVLSRDRGLAAKLEHFVSENVALIKSVESDLHDRVEKIVTRAVTEGRPHGVVAKEIARRFEVSESHARLIARDQIGKLYGQINVARQKELGVKRFIWRAVDDERTRDEHREFEEQSDPELGGEPFDFDDPPNGELPGVPIQCRCTAEPVMADLFDAE